MTKLQIMPKTKKVTCPPFARKKCDELGIDAICEMLTSGISATRIAKQIDVSVGTLLNWIDDDITRSARVREARMRSAKYWDEKAEEVIREAPDKFELERARELAHHYRWRAKAIAPRDYGDRVTQEHTGKDGAPITMATVDMRNLSDKELENMQALLTKAAGTGT